MMRMHSLVISVVEGLPDVQISSRRVLQTNAEIMDGLKPCLNKDTAESLADLLNQDLVYTVQHAQTIRGGNQKSIADSWDRLTHNTGHMTDTLCKCGEIDRDKLKREYAEYQAMLKDEMAHRSGRR